MTLSSGLYCGRVTHQRLRPRRHRLSYRVFAMVLDLDELPMLGERLRLFGHNRPAPLAFRDTDHGPGTGGPLRPWVEARLNEAGIEPDDGAIRLLCYPRIFGYVFNPLSVYFCHRRDGALSATIYEVNNTFGERHCYVVPVSAAGPDRIDQTCRKRMHVSPFLDLDAGYAFRVRPPGESVALTIHEVDADGPRLTAVFRGRRRGLSDLALAGVLLRYPLMTLKVIAAIHWEAFLLWRKGLRVIPHRPAQAAVTTSAWPAVTSVE